MKTKIITKTNLPEAVHALQQGEVVAFPTETVYGLGAIATSQEAVLKVFAAKGRPSDNPLIVHVSDVDTVKNSVENFPKEAQLLADAFWPGPLTMILQAKPGIYAPALSAGLSTVSFRMPDHELTLEMIREVGIPLVGPSANRSTKPSPTKVSHVLEDMDGRIFGIVEGGDTRVGVESTVIDLTNDGGPVILRPGVITKEQIESVIGPIATQQTIATGEKVTPKSPGMKYRHYAPTTPVIALGDDISRWKEWIEQYHHENKKVGMMATEKMIAGVQSSIEAVYSLGNTIEDMNHHLFDALRTLDHAQVDVILAQTTTDQKAGLAYMNRLKKAASTVVK